MSPEVLPFAYGVNEFTTMPWTFEEDVQNYAALGVEALELCETKLDDDRAEEQLAPVAEADLPICSVQPAVRAMIPASDGPSPATGRNAWPASAGASNSSPRTLPTHLYERFGPVRYKVACVGVCVLYDREKLLDVGGFSFWEELAPADVGEDVLAQRLLRERYGGCAVLPGGSYHLEAETTLPERSDAGVDRLLGRYARATERRQGEGRRGSDPPRAGPRSEGGSTDAQAG